MIRAPALHSYGNHIQRIPSQYAEDPLHLQEKWIIFDKFVQPHLCKLKRDDKLDQLICEVPEIQEYLDLCVRPVRKFEHAFALQCLLAYLKPGDLYLDIGCGASPLPHVVAAQGFATKACDVDASLVRRLRQPAIHAIYGKNVNYAIADITKLHEADATFDAIACLSILDHVPTPKVRRAMEEVLRVLKPGGLLVITLGFRAAQLMSIPSLGDVPSGMVNSYHFCIKLLTMLISNGVLIESGSQLLQQEDLQWMVTHRGQAAASPIPHPSTLDQAETSQRVQQQLLPLTLALQKPL